MVKAGDPLLIDLRNVAKTYKRRVRALKGIEIRVHAGEIFGLLGPNGAGKSTLVKIIMTVIRPDRAEGTVLGRRVGHKPTLARVGYMPENARFPLYLTGRQALEFYAALAGLQRADRRRRAGELLDTVRLTEAADRKVGTYSKGMVQRLGVAQAMVHAPDLVVLDEPTDGVDPLGRMEIRRVLQAMRNKGQAVFLNSHMLGELEMVCDRVAILNQGEVVRQGTIDELTQNKQFYELEVDVAPGSDPAQTVRSVLDVPLRVAMTDSEGRQTLEGTLADGRGVELKGGVLRVGGIDAAAIQPIIDRLRAHELVIRSIRPRRQSLEDLFIEVVGAEIPTLTGAEPIRPGSFPFAPPPPPPAAGPQGGAR